MKDADRMRSVDGATLRGAGWSSSTLDRDTKNRLKLTVGALIAS